MLRRGRGDTTAAGFEPARAEPNGFRVRLLNHSDTLSFAPVSPIGSGLVVPDSSGHQNVLTSTEDRTRNLSRVRRTS